jgi:hypothetical protein
MAEYGIVGATSDIQNTVVGFMRWHSGVNIRLLTVFAMPYDLNFEQNSSAI